MASNVYDIAPILEASFLVILSAFVSLVAIYTLLILVKNRFSSRRQAANNARLPVQLCQACEHSNLNCKIIYNKRTATRVNGDVCARCGGAIKSQVSNDILRQQQQQQQHQQQQNLFGSYGTQQHPIIFGKSKDSILVPELVGELADRFHGAQLSGDSDLQPAAMTRVLTDEKGHSIKIRIASPPPQRQSQLTIAREQPSDGRQKGSQVAARAVSSGDEATMLGWRSPEPRRSQQQRGAMAHQRPQSSMAHFQAGGGGGGSAAQDNIGNENEEQQQQQQQQQRAEVAPPSGGLLDEAAGDNGRRGKSGEEQAKALQNQFGGDSERRQAPIEAFNDSNDTSEFDDATAWGDSRQDTSIDFVTLADGQVKSNDAGNGPINRCSSTGDDHETVMDADVRKTSRLNMELMVLQSTAQQAIGGGQLGVVSRTRQVAHPAAPVLATLGRSARSKSLSGAAAAFSQSGFLPSASDHYQQRRESGAFIEMGAQSGGRKWRTNTSSTDEHDSGIAGEDSRRSSEQLTELASFAPSLRLSIKPLNPPTKEEETQQQQMHSLQVESKSRSILNTLASIGRSRSSERPEAEDPQQHREEAEQLIEVRLIEARNISRKHKNSSTNSTQSTVSASAEQTGSGRTRSRRESLLGALVAAATSAPQRRPSVESVFARIFKNQAANSGLDYKARLERAELASNKNKSEQAVAMQMASSHYDSLSLHSSSSLPLPANADYLQLAPVKLAAAAGEACLNPASSSSLQSPSAWINFSELYGGEPYGFVCKLSEFPIRISLYQMGKRGARYTLGHCFVGPNDWLSDNNNSQLQPLDKRLSSGSTSSSQSADQAALSSFVRLAGSWSAEPTMQDGGRRQTVEAEEEEEEARMRLSEDGIYLLEYKLYQTILDAISSRQ